MRPVITIGDAVVPVWRVAHLVPPSIEYLYEVIGLVPAAPAVNLTESDPEEGVMVMPVGALGATGVGGFQSLQDVLLIGNTTSLSIDFYSNNTPTSGIGPGYVYVEDDTTNYGWAASMSGQDPYNLFFG